MTRSLGALADRDRMRLTTWPETLLWQHYVHAQVAAAALDLIGDDLLALGVEIGDGSVHLHALTSVLTDDMVDDLDHIAFDLDVLLDGHTLITTQVALLTDVLGSWPPSGVNLVYLAKGALRDPGAT